MANIIKTPPVQALGLTPNPVVRNGSFTFKPTGFFLGLTGGPGGAGFSGSSSLFVDSSAYQRTLTPHGGLKVTTQFSKWDGGSAIFNGSDAYLTIADDPVLRFQGDWCVDFWFYPLADSGDLFGKYNTNSVTPVGLRLQGDGHLHAYISIDGTTFTGTGSANGTSVGTININQWNHVAVQSHTSSLLINFFVNGALINIPHPSLNVPFSGTDTFALGARLISGVASNFFNGYIDEFHWVDQVVFFTTSIQVPIQAWSQPGVQGFYTVPASHIFNAQRLLPMTLQIDWTSPASALLTDFFAPSDFFNQTDVFGTTTPGLTDVHPEVNISQDGVNFLGWQRYRPGSYNAWKANVRMNLQAFDANVAAGLETLTLSAYVPTRTDSLLVSGTLPSAGQTFLFTPDGSVTPAPFNGGPNGASVPAVNVVINNAASGDFVVISNLSLGAVTIQGFNGASTKALNCTVTATGY